MTFPNKAGDHADTDAILSQELEQAGITVVTSEIFRHGRGEVKTSVRGTLHGWSFERAWYYWVATGPGIDADTAEALYESHGVSVRVDGHGASPSPREHFKGLGAGHYHVDDQKGLNAIAAAIRSVVAMNGPSPESPYAEQNSVGKEIERKFLVNDGWRDQVKQSSTLRQGYLNSNPERTVRVRIQDGRAVQTIKGVGDESGEERPELNMKLTPEQAEFMFSVCESGIIHKTRHFIPNGEHLFEVDEFWAENEGLVLAEISFKVKGEQFEKPHWLGEEVTGRNEYYNSSLSKRPFKSWGSEKPAG
jgi:CYTH domain-containing protein